MSIVQKVPEKSELIAVAYNFRCPRATAELGEDFYELRKLERARVAFMRRLERTLNRVASHDAALSLQELHEVLPDVFRDASFDKLMRDATAAFDEAHVRLVRRAIAQAHTAPLPFYEGVCPICGVGLDETNTSQNAADRGETRCARCEGEGGE